MFDPNLIPAGIVRCNPQSRVLSANATMLRWAGLSDVSEVLGRPFYAVLAPAGRIYFETHIRPMLMVEGTVQEIAFELLTPSGKRRRIYLNGHAERDESGEIVALHYACFSGGHRQSYERELVKKRRDAEGYVALVQSSADAILNADRDGCIVSWNAAAEHLFGYTEAEVAGENWRSLLVGKTPEVPTAASSPASPDAPLTYRAEADARHSDGTAVAVEYHEAPLQDDDGDVMGTVVVLRDIRERRQADETIQALSREVLHRSKNQFAIIQAIARSTARHSSADDFVGIFTRRLDALSRNMELLTTASRTTADLAELVESQLKHLSKDQKRKVTVDGPGVQLSENQALYIGLAIFELSTNAIKYGALSEQAGETSAIDISWSLNDATLAFQWRESGMTSVVPPTQKGFGSRLTSEMLERSTRGKVTADYKPTGLIWQLDVAL